MRTWHELRVNFTTFLKPEFHSKLKDLKLKKRRENKRHERHGLRSEQGMAESCLHLLVHSNRY